MRDLADVGSEGLGLMTEGRPTVRVPVRAPRPVLVEGLRALTGGLSRSSKVCSEQRGHLTSRFIEACTVIAYSIARIVVTVIAAVRTFAAQLLKYATGRPLRLAAPDAVQPLQAAVVPADSAAAIGLYANSVIQLERVAPSGAPRLARRRGP